MATKKKSSSTAAATLKGKPGKSGKGADFDPTQPSHEMFAAATVELNEPRPSTERYPIPEAEFIKLKEAARKKKVAKGSATIAKDKGKKTEVSPMGLAEF